MLFTIYQFLNIEYNSPAFYKGRPYLAADVVWCISRHGTEVCATICAGRVQLLSPLKKAGYITVITFSVGLVIAMVSILLIAITKKNMIT